MAKVLVSVKIYPKDVETDRSEIVDAIRKQLPKDYEIVRTAEEPIAFGYTALKTYITIPEETEGGTNKLEEILKSIDKIDNFEVESVHRLSEF
jgi:elongation factor 1-beta